MSVYARPAASADRLLEKYGGPVTLSRPSTGARTYNTATGTATAVAPATYYGTGAVFDYRQDEIDGTLIQDGDQRLYLSPFQTNGADMPEPTSRDFAIIGGITYSVARVGKVAPGGVNVLFDLTLRL
jgi:hypothetical protein